MSLIYEKNNVEWDFSRIFLRNKEGLKSKMWNIYLYGYNLFFLPHSFLTWADVWLCRGRWEETGQFFSFQSRHFFIIILFREHTVLFLNGIRRFGHISSFKLPLITREAFNSNVLGIVVLVHLDSVNACKQRFIELILLGFMNGPLLDLEVDKRHLSKRLLIPALGIGAFPIWLSWWH